MRNAIWLLLPLAGCGEVKAGDDAAIADSDAGDSIDAGQDPECPAGMAFVPGGMFTLTNKPGTAVIEPFCMDVTHVTAGDYAACATCSPAAATTECNTGIAFRATDPANCVDAAQAEFYCESIGKALPTEEQWEWAARGGPAGNTYAWGNDDPLDTDDPVRLCWEAGRNDVAFPDRPSGTCPVGSADQSGFHPFELEDMSGNVWTWTTSIGTTSANRVVRGGGWDNTLASRMTTGFRNDAIPATTRHQALGFRCVDDPLP